MIAFRLSVREMKTKPQDTDGKKVHRLTDIVVEEVSIVDRPANLRPFLVVKSADHLVGSEIQVNDDGELVVSLTKANEPKDGLSNDELRALRDKRSKAFGIEVVEVGSALTFPSGFPTMLEEYGDPANLKFPVDTKARAANARVRFKQFASNYKSEDSKRVVHTRIVEAELKFGINPSIDPDDLLDKLLSVELRERSEQAGEEKDAGNEKTSKAGAKMSRERMEQLATAIDSLSALKDSLVPESLGPSAGSAQAKKDDDDDENGVTKLMVEMANRMDSISTSVGKLHEVVKNQERRIRKSADRSSKRDVVQASSRIDVDKGRRSVEPSTSWPMDMNQEETPGNTPDHRSFFDD